MHWFPLCFCMLYAVTGLFGRALWMRWKWGVTDVALYNSRSREGSLLMLLCYHLTALAIVGHSALWGLGILWPWGLWPRSTGVELAGCGLIVAGWLAVLVAQTHLGPAWRVGIVDAPTPLRTAGFYRHVRNPIYSGLIVAMLGMFLVMPTILMLCFVGLTAVGLRREVLLEERHLERMHGEAFRRYRDSTGRWSPRFPGAAA